MATKPTSKPRRSTSRQVGLKHGFRSGLEDANADHLKALGHPVVYEQDKLKYTIPSRTATYTPDFRLRPGRYVETKGRFVTADRKKHLLFKAEHPEIEIRFVFSNSRAKISKQSKTTYADWCEKNGFLYADKLIPREWLDA